MDTIEQRVIIPASPQVIWNIVSQLEQNPTWQVDCRRVQFASQKREGRGTRWRQTTAGGQEQLFEITAWYEEVGYEYRLVEGAVYDDGVGRIKMHETPDGTVVHWEFQYSLSGFISGLRNTLLTRRNLQNIIGESLWALWELANHAKVNQPRDYVYRSMMRDAPNVEQRASYAPREHKEAGIHFIPEPLVSEDDTRPHAATTPDQADTASTSTDAQPSPYARPRQATESDLRASHTSESTEEVTSSVETGITSPAREPEAAEVAQEVELDEPAATTPIPDALQTEVMPRAPELAYLDESVEDTSEISVFDLFGMDRPSDPDTPLAEEDRPSQEEATTDIESGQIEAMAHDEAKPVSQPMDTSSGRRGLRLLLRRSLVEIQRPE